MESRSLPRLDRDPDCHKNLITCSYYHPKLLHKVSLQSIYNFLSNVAKRQTDTHYREHNLEGDIKSYEWI